MEWDKGEHFVISRRIWDEHSGYERSSSRRRSFVWFVIRADSGIQVFPSGRRSRPVGAGVEIQSDVRSDIPDQTLDGDLGGMSSLE